MFVSQQKPTLMTSWWLLLKTRLGWEPESSKKWRELSYKHSIKYLLATYRKTDYCPEFWDQLKRTTMPYMQQHHWLTTPRTTSLKMIRSKAWSSCTIREVSISVLRTRTLNSNLLHLWRWLTRRIVSTRITRRASTMLPSTETPSRNTTSHNLNRMLKSHPELWTLKSSRRERHGITPWASPGEMRLRGLRICGVTTRSTWRRRRSSKNAFSSSTCLNSSTRSQGRIPTKIVRAKS